MSLESITCPMVALPDSSCGLSPTTSTDSDTAGGRQRGVELHALADVHLYVLIFALLKAAQLDGDGVGAGQQKDGRVLTRAVGGLDDRRVRAVVHDGDGDAGQRAAGRIDDKPAKGSPRFLRAKSRRPEDQNTPKDRQRKLRHSSHASSIEGPRTTPIIAPNAWH